MGIKMSLFKGNMCISENTDLTEHINSVYLRVATFIYSIQYRLTSVRKKQNKKLKR